MIGLTPKQKALLDFICATLERSGIAPSIREMASHCGDAETSAVRGRLKSLEAKGCIRRFPHKHRAIEILTPRMVELNPEIHRLAKDYANEHGIPLETATNELLRGALGASQ